MTGRKDQGVPAGPFAHSWRAGILDQRPLIAPVRSYTYPRQAEEVERGALEILVQPDAGAEWLGTFALGFADALAPTGMWSHPHPDVLCAVAGGYAYLVNTCRPEHFEQVKYRPVLAVHAVIAPADLLLFVGNRAITAYHRDGQAWESPCLSDEGVTVVAVTESAIEGVGWRLKGDREVAFAVDLGTGACSWAASSIE